MSVRDGEPADGRENVHATRLRARQLASRGVDGIPGAAGRAVLPQRRELTPPSPRAVSSVSGVSGSPSIDELSADLLAVSAELDATHLKISQGIARQERLLASRVPVRKPVRPDTAALTDANDQLRQRVALLERENAALTLQATTAVVPRPAPTVVLSVPVCLVQEFSGRNDSLLVDAWIQRALAWWSNADKSTFSTFGDEHFVPALAGRLIGEARTWYEHTFASAVPPLESFFSQLKAAHTDRDGHARSFASLVACKQDGRSMEEFIADFQFRVANLAPHADGSPRVWLDDRDFFTTIFRLGLDSYYAQEVRKSPPSPSSPKEELLDKLRGLYAAKRPAKPPAATSAGLYVAALDMSHPSVKALMDASTCFACGYTPSSPSDPAKHRARDCTKVTDRSKWVHGSLPRRSDF